MNINKKCETATKYLLLKRKMINDVIPVWNKVIQSNSGKSVADLVKAFVIKCYADACNKVLEDKKLTSQ